MGILGPPCPDFYWAKELLTVHGKGTPFISEENCSLCSAWFPQCVMTNELIQVDMSISQNKKHPAETSTKAGIGQAPHVPCLPLCS